MNAAPARELQLILLQLDADVRKLSATLQALSRHLPFESEPGDTGLSGVDAADDTAPSPGEGRWALRDLGWTLVAPDGRSFGLTTAEREFMTALLSAPGYRLTRRELQSRGVGEAENDSEAQASRGLDVMVSRLRRKALAAGISLPVRSVRRWGYMFAAEAEK